MLFDFDLNLYFDLIVILISIYNLFLLDFDWIFIAVDFDQILIRFVFELVLICFDLTLI